MSVPYIFTLPFELLSYIFQLASPPITIPSESRTDPRLCLPAVCKRFRSVTIRSAPLWSCFLFPMPFPTAATWLARTRELPLEILCDGQYLEDFEMAALHRFMMLEGVMARCSSLKVDACAHFLLDDVLKLPAPMLHTAELAFCNGGHVDLPECDFEPTIDNIPVPFPNAPELRHLRLVEAPFLVPQFLLAKLTTLDVVFPSAPMNAAPFTPHDLLDIFEGSKGLKTIRLDNLRFPYVPGQPLDTMRTSRRLINMPSLATAVFLGPTIENLSEFLPHISAPRLETIEIHVGGWKSIAEDLFIPEAPSFFSNVRSASLFGVGDPCAESGDAERLLGTDDDFFVLNPEEIGALLLEAPKVSFLCITLNRMDDDFFRLAFTLQPDVHEYLAPNLQRFHLIGCHGFSEEVMLSMVKSRMDPKCDGHDTVKALMDVKLENCPGIGVEALKELDGLFGGHAALV